MKILAIDPSVNNVGFALYDTESDILRTKLLHPERYSNGSTLDICIQIIHCYRLNFAIIPDVMIIEYPHWQGSTKGGIAAMKGYTLDLAAICGYLLASIKSPVQLAPTPSQWKGQTPKKATEHRVRKQFGDLKISEHEFDAVGMIQWYLNKTKK